MLYIICGLIGLIVGAAVAWLLAANRAGAAVATTAELRGQLDKAEATCQDLRGSLDAAIQVKVKAETELAQTTQRLAEERRTLEDARARLSDAFKALAGEALGKNTEAFLALAKATFEKVVVEAKGELGKRQEAIDGLVKPLADSLHKFEEHIRGLEKTRQEAYTGLEGHIKALTTTQAQLQKETTGLVTALRTPQVRGRWGELTLKRVVELAGMSEHFDFIEQVSVDSDAGRLRPDMIVHLPGEREIVVDSKVSLDAYLDAVDAASEKAREDALKRHAAQIRTHMNKLAGKSYWQKFDKAPEFAVMFIPGESFFAAAVDVDRGLIEDSLEKGVILATPTTLMALLLAVAYGWRQEQAAKNAQGISELGRELYERMRVLAGHIQGIGGGLERANAAYNSAVGSMEARVLPAARRFKDLGAGTSEDIPVILSVETTPRQLSVPETDGAEESPA